MIGSLLRRARALRWTCERLEASPMSRPLLRSRHAKTRACVRCSSGERHRGRTSSRPASSTRARTASACSWTSRDVEIDVPEEPARRSIIGIGGCRRHRSCCSNCCSSRGPCRNARRAWRTSGTSRWSPTNRWGPAFPMRLTSPTSRWSPAYPTTRGTDRRPAARRLRRRRRQCWADWSTGCVRSRRCSSNRAASRCRCRRTGSSRPRCRQRRAHPGGRRGPKSCAWS